MRAFRRMPSLHAAVRPVSQSNSQSQRRRPASVQRVLAANWALLTAEQAEVSQTALQLRAADTVQLQEIEIDNAGPQSFLFF